MTEADKWNMVAALAGLSAVWELVWYLVSGRAFDLWFAGIALATAVVCIVTGYVKGRSHGSDRRAAEDHPDSASDDPGTATGGDAAAGRETGAGTGPLIASGGVCVPLSGVTFRVTRLGPNGEVLGTDPPRDLPVVQRSEPIVTWKQASLVRQGCEVELRPLNAGFPSPMFSPSTSGMLHVFPFPSPVRPDAQAVCNNARPHRAPAVDCTCGFYAYDKRPPSDPALVVLEVELSGTVIEHETGYRAQYQRVLGCYLPSRCRAGLLCDQPPVAVRFKEDGKPGEAVCEHHTYPRLGEFEFVSLSQLSGALGIECRWDDQGDDR